jgi:hypothetical protein
MPPRSYPTLYNSHLRPKMAASLLAATAYKPRCWGNDGIRANHVYILTLIVWTAISLYGGKRSISVSWRQDLEDFKEHPVKFRLQTLIISLTAASGFVTRTKLHPLVATELDFRQAIFENLDRSLQNSYTPYTVYVTIHVTVSPGTVCRATARRKDNLSAVSVAVKRKAGSDNNSVSKMKTGIPILS